MKKLFAIILLTVYLFNLAGYSLLFQYLINNADTQFVKSLDNNSYNDKDLVEVKVALNMPYLNTANDFERVNGQLELNGVRYNYVKRKVSKDTLYVLCLPNFSKTELYNAKADYAKESSDVPAGKKNAESAAKKINSGNEYNYITTHFDFSAQLLSHSFENGFLCSKITPVFINPPVQPPDSGCC